MRFLLIAVSIAVLAGCGPSSTTTSMSTNSTAMTADAVAAQDDPGVWAICDGVDAARVFVFTGGAPGPTATMIAYDKSQRTAVAAPAETYDMGEGEDAMGSIYTPLNRNGQPAVTLRETNPGALETPGAAYTSRLTSIQMGDGGSYMCRWMPRTRLMGISNRRTFVINEDADGDLIYTTYDFGVANPAPIDTSDNGVTTTFSLEVRGGEEHVSAEGSEFVFNNNGYRYTVRATHGPAEVRVEQNGRVIQTEPLLAYLLGTAAQTAN